MYSKIERVKLTLDLSVQYTAEPPVLEIKNNNQVVFHKTPIGNSQVITLDLFLPNDRAEAGVFEIVRSNFDGVNQQVLTLDKLSLDGINLNKICHHAKYHPIYPEPWITEQRTAGTHWPEYLTGVTSWGWNGTWTLEYRTPIYTWLLKNV